MKKLWILLLVAFIATLLIVGFYPKIKLFMSEDQNPGLVKRQIVIEPTPIFTIEMQDGKFGLRLGMQLMTPCKYDSIDVSGSYPILYSNVKDKYIFSLKSGKKIRLAGPFTRVDQIDPDIFLVGPVYGDYAFYKPIGGDLIFKDTIRSRVKGVGGLFWVYTKSGKKGIFSNLEYRGYILPIDYYSFVKVKKDYLPYISCIGVSETFHYYIQYYTKNSWGMSHTQIGGEMGSAIPRICRNKITNKNLDAIFGINTSIDKIYDNGFAILKSGSNYALLSNGCGLVVPFKYHDYLMTDSVGYFFSDSTTLIKKIIPISGSDIDYRLRKEADPELYDD
ncbi:MAG: hypothetical protein PHE20_01495 [Patescibacteria group bacterium]|nr:hypothetical protein [Patescibacteria group bacterium]